VDPSRPKKLMLRVLEGEAVAPPPVWMMRQAGRYLPEYRAVRAEAPDFMAFCADAEKSAEVTFQPIRRFGFDAAIVFSDIMVVPHAIGQRVWFETGEGPRLEPVADRRSLDGLTAFDETKVSGTLQALRTLHAGLPSTVALIGFCGAPWTIATYMVAGRGTPDKGPAKALAAADRGLFADLIDRVVEASISYLVAQVDAGAEILQIFDSWAGALDSEGFALWSIEPIARILDGVRSARPGVPIIVFAREAAIPALAEAQSVWRAEGLSLGQGTSISEARRALGPNVALQGNLDPDVLVEGGAALEKAVARILAETRGTPHIFNLGHGIVPQTPISHVELMLAQVRGA
jgi:uroporphyrinogen decarboxylase